ncbi:uncharacterized protein [Patagioenas fasciata]|uniref:uncharacterized protein isoform X2 n=1 Tax=Patagioenas fasciata TaxID=372321 RepID=UPI003A9A0C3A
MSEPGRGALNRPLDMSQRSCSRKCAEHPLGPAFHSSGSDSMLPCAGQLPRTEIPRTPHPMPIPARTAQDQPRCSRPGPESSDGLPQGPGADGEDVTGSASPELMFSMDFDTEWEKEQLLKDEAAGSPKAELSSWNRLFNVNRLRGSSHKYGAPGRLMEPESEGQPLSDAANPSAMALAERFSEDRARETHWLPWEKLGMAGSRWSRNPWRRLRSVESDERHRCTDTGHLSFPAQLCQGRSTAGCPRRWAMRQPRASTLLRKAGTAPQRGKSRLLRSAQEGLVWAVGRGWGLPPSASRPLPHAKPRCLVLSSCNSGVGNSKIPLENRARGWFLCLPLHGLGVLLGCLLS